MIRAIYVSGTENTSMAIVNVRAFWYIGPKTALTSLLMKSVIGKLFSVPMHLSHELITKIFMSQREREWEKFRNHSSFREITNAFKIIDSLEKNVHVAISTFDLKPRLKLGQIKWELKGNLRSKKKLSSNERA